MALARCKECGPPNGRTNSYKSFRLPLGYPDTAVICGRQKCDGPAYVWFTSMEQAAYGSGERVFALSTNTVKVRVQ